MAQGGDATGARATLEGAHARPPGDVGTLVALARVHAQTGRHDRALRAYLSAVRQAPRHAPALRGLADTLVTLGHLDKAIRCYQGALAAAPEDASTHAALAWTLTRTGEAPAAKASMQPRIERPDASATELAVWGTACLHSGAPDEAADRLLRGFAALAKRTDRCVLGHVLGDCLDHLGRHEEAFAVYAEANRSNPCPGYDADAHTRYVERILACYAAEATCDWPRIPDDDQGPNHVLIVGMPRSGTSLVEQILGQHSGVFTCGELPALQALSATLGERLGSTAAFPEAMGSLTPDSLRALRSAYERHHRRAPIGTRGSEPGGTPGSTPGGTLCVTDKMPDNYLWLGLARTFLRRLRVVYCVRDPLDTCWSAFTKNFGDNLRYTTDLTWLGRRYRDHTRLMERAQESLGDSLLRVPYEALVQDRETWIPAIVQHCRLPFEPDCLRPEANPRTVATASYAQVRKPIHSGAIGRAQAYRPWLEALEAALTEP